MSDSEQHAPVKVIKCSTCGASPTIHLPDVSEVMACESCGSIYDISDDTPNLIRKYNRKRQRIRIPLGQRGTVNGEEVQVLGFLQKQTRDGGATYTWGEYLLYNPYLGYRWLTEYKGHWCYLKTIKQSPGQDMVNNHRIATYQETDYKHFTTSKARVSYVTGEFYWQVKVGERTEVHDFISPPYLLSQEIIRRSRKEREHTWSFGEYVEPKAIKEGFGLKGAMKKRAGAGANQPNLYRLQTRSYFVTLITFLAIAVIIQYRTVDTALNQQILGRRFTYEKAGSEKSLVTDTFELPGRTSNVSFDITTDLDNNWAYFNMALINETSGKAYDFGREVSFYRGTDSEGYRWSEGQTNDEFVIPSVPEGRYFLRIEPDSSAPTVKYSIRMFRDVPQWSYFIYAVLLICLPYLIFMLVRWNFELRRWAESDYVVEEL